MAVSLTGLTLHVADVDRALEFYRRLPSAEVLFHRPAGLPSSSWVRDALACLPIRNVCFTSHSNCRTWTPRPLNCET